MGVNVAVTGATGRMGRAVLDAASDREDVEAAFAVARDAAERGDAGAVADVPVEPARDLDRLLADRDPDALVDFTAPESSVEYVAAAAEAGVASVVGTTGFDDEGERALRESAERAPVLKAANFGRGVHALASAVESGVADLPGYDVEVTETHHNRKRDAPSGTAKTILETIEDARADDPERVHGREGEAPREAGEIGVHARRAGSITGEHEVLLAGNHEEVRLTHRSEDRGVFAEGALDAAVWLAGRDPGWYDFADAVGATGETTDGRDATDGERGGRPMSLESEIRDLWHRYDAGDLTAESAGADERATLDAFLDALETGEVRAAEKRDGSWEANEWVKHGILLNFGLRAIEGREYGDVTYHDVLPLRETGDLPERGTRNTPDGTVLRRGAYVGSDAILMSPSFVNIGAHVGDGTLVDSCDTVGSCAQIGADVKLGANTLVGGVLEPVEDAPVVVEDGASLGAGCRVTSGFVVGENSVVAENTLLTPRIPVYDLVDEEIRYGRLPPERRAFTRFVASSVGDHDLFDGGAYKPAVVAMDLEATTMDGVEREEALRE